MGKITKVVARQVFDSRGNPTVEAEIFVKNLSSSSIWYFGASRVSLPVFSFTILIISVQSNENVPLSKLNEYLFFSRTRSAFSFVTFFYFTFKRHFLKMIDKKW